MSDELLLPPASPGTPPEIQPPPAHDSTRTENPVGNPTLENIRKTAGKVFSWGGQMFQKGRGRPGAGGAPGKGDIPLGSAENPDGMEAPLFENPPAPLGNRFAIYHKSIVSGIKGLLKILGSWIGLKASRAGFSGDFVSEIKREMFPVTGTPEEKEFNDAVESFAANLELVLEKYNVSIEFAPELALGLDGFRLAQPFMATMGKLNAEIERRKKTEAPAKP